MTDRGQKAPKAKCKCNESIRKTVNIHGILFFRRRSIRVLQELVGRRTKLYQYLPGETYNQTKSKVALPLDKRNTNAAALLILFSQLADFRRAAQRNGFCS